MTLEIFQEYLSLILSGIVALSLVIFIINLLEYHFGAGEAGRRSEAVKRIIFGSTLLGIVSMTWITYRLLVSILFS
ncbi:MAG: hypothetical protein WAX38_00955 [Minisyncoccia bacterium]